MSPIPWKTEINFASALLLHSCITVLLKEAINILVIAKRCVLRFWYSRVPRTTDERFRDEIRTSIVLDAYTSILSLDQDGELSELYYTNTGVILLAVSLVSSVVMNLMLSSKFLNGFVVATFGVGFLASLAVGEKELTLPILALRRAGRFVWSDTPFVNFFSLIYIATVLHGNSALRLQDYITFRCIAVLELIFMKAKLAASNSETQVRLLRRLVESEWVAMKSKPGVEYLDQSFPMAHRNDMVPFKTIQRLSVMMFKTAVSFHFGCLQGWHGPASCPVPEIGSYIDEPMYGWRVYRLSDDIMFISDCLAEFNTKSESASKRFWTRLIISIHGILLRRLGNVRVIYFVRTGDGAGSASVWHSNINLVTGVSNKWLNENFQPSDCGEKCVVAGI